MNKTTKLISALLLVATTIALPLSSKADGMVIIPDDNIYLKEKSQQVVINMEGGMQKMVVAINTDQTDKKALWLLPVPATPEKITIDVAEYFPDMYGSDVKISASEQLDKIRAFLLSSQIYPTFFTNIFESNYYDKAYTNSLAVPEKAGDASDMAVQVEETLTKDGITVELITAKESDALSEYFKSKDLDVKEDITKVLDQYIGKDFSFVAAWLDPNYEGTDYGDVIPLNADGREATESSSAEGSAEKDIAPEIAMYPYPYSPTRGIVINFPSDDVYFPMIPTSVYGSETVPLVLKIAGYYEANLNKELKSFATTTYHHGGYVEFYPQMTSLFTNTYDLEKDYTKLEINAPSKYFTEDLTLEKGMPAKERTLLWISKYPFPIALVLFAIISMLASTLSALIVFKESRAKNKWWKYLLFGLFNLLSFIGLIIATLFKKTKEPTEDQLKFIEEAKSKGLNARGILTKDSRKWGFLVLFTAIFVAVSMISISLLSLMA